MNHHHQSYVRNDEESNKLRDDLTSGKFYFNKILNLITKYISIGIAQGGVLSHIDSDLSSNKRKCEEDDAGRVETQHFAQGESIMIIQSQSLMENSGMKNKSMSPTRESLDPSALQRKSNKKNQYNNPGQKSR